MHTVRNLKNMLLLSYQGGYCGEFLQLVLMSSGRFMSVNYDYGPTTNRYIVHTPFIKTQNNPRTGEIIGTYLDSGNNSMISRYMAAMQGNADHRVILRTHLVSDVKKMINLVGNPKTVIVYSSNYHRFFINLFWIKKVTAFQKTNDQTLIDLYGTDLIADWQFSYAKSKHAPGSIQDYVSSIEHDLPQQWFYFSRGPNITQFNDSQYFLLDLDRIFFNFDQRHYDQYCEFAGIESHALDPKLLEKYHQKNIQLLVDRGISIESNNNVDQLKKDWLTIGEQSLLDPIQEYYRPYPAEHLTKEQLLKLYEISSLT